MKREVVYLDILSSKLLKDALLEFFTIIENKKYRHQNHLCLLHTGIGKFFLEDMIGLSRTKKISFQLKEIMIYNKYTNLGDKRIVTLDEYTVSRDISDIWPSLRSFDCRLTEPAIIDPNKYMACELKINHSYIAAAYTYFLKFLKIKEDRTSLLYSNNFNIFSRMIVLVPNALYNRQTPMSQIINNSIIIGLITFDEILTYYQYASKKFKILDCFHHYLRATVKNKSEFLNIMYS